MYYADRSGTLKLSIGTVPKPLSGSFSVAFREINHLSKWIYHNSQWMIMSFPESCSFRTNIFKWHAIKKNQKNLQKWSSNDSSQIIHEEALNDELVMRIPCMRVYLVLLCLAVTDTSYLSMLPLTSGTLLESVASSIIKYYAAVMYDAQIICESTCVSDEFLKTIPVPFQLSKPILHEKSFLFLLPQTKSFIKRVLNGTVNFTKSKYIVLIDGGNCTTVAWILEQCWHRKLLNVVVIPLQNNSSPIYTYFPFREGFCFDPSPFQIASFTNTSVFNIELFPERKVWNLQNCTLKVSSFNFNPGIYFDGTGMHGHYSPVFRAVADAMNFSLSLIHIWRCRRRG